jgi:nucleotide-binding universal stress UspA family protein
MTTLIVPTDFSDTARNAAIYAAGMAAAIPGARVILYYEYDNILAGSDGTPLSDEGDARQQIAQVALQHVKEAMQAAAGNIQVSYVAREEESFLQSFEKFILSTQPDLVIMGIREATGIELSLVGSSTLNLVDKSICPVMIIPPAARFNGIRKVLLATDLDHVEPSAVKMQGLLQLFRPQVDVVHVSEADLLPNSGATEKQVLEHALQAYPHRFYMIRHNDVEHALNEFVAQNPVDCIMMVPHKHSFFSNLFHNSHTRKLAYHSSLPVLAIPG